MPAFSTTTCLIRSIACLAVAVSPLIMCGPVQADLVKLLNGGEVRGKIIGGTHSGRSSSDTIVVETLSGITISVTRGDTKFLTMRPLSVEEYETRVRKMEETLEAHLELAEWCRQQNLTKQRETHLLRVVEFDPHHEKAQTALGRTWHEGAWVDRDEMMASRGYVKYKGKYVTVQELDLIQKSADELAVEREWFQKVKTWHGWLNGRNEDRYRQAMLAVQTITDPHAAPAIIRFFCEDKQRDLRVLGVTVLSKLNGSKGAAGLVKLSLFDPDGDVRYASLNGIAEEDFEFAQTAYIRELRNSLNPVVCRAAAGLARVGDERAVAPLIEALVTSHRYEVQTNAPATQVYSATTDGNAAVASGGVLPPEVELAVRTGQLPQGAIIAPPIGGVQIPRKTTVMTVNVPNHDTLTTLQKLTGQNFGFDERTWRLWWAAEKHAASGPNPKK